MMRQPVPEGYSFVKMIDCSVEDSPGFEYEIKEVSIMKDEEGRFFLRTYWNFCTCGANGRPVTSVRDSCVQIPDPSVVSKQNYLEIQVFTKPEITFIDDGGDYLDSSTKNWVKKNCTKR